VGNAGQSDADCCGPATPAKSTAKSKAKVPT
jgi:hypothetical protein